MSDRALRVVVTGTVQGVGFRPHVVRAARAASCRGSVANTARGVEIEVVGRPAALERFVDALRRAPAPAVVERVDAADIDPFDARDFVVVERAGTDRAPPSLAPDLAPCKACVDEVLATSGRRARYPFTSCAACGPRASVARALPWERAHTTMAPFVPCTACAREYGDVDDRRFRAETIACPACGPTLSLVDIDGAARTRGDDALVDACDAIVKGGIVAVKGVGGFQLMCDATDDDAVRRLRALKARPTKPFVLLVASLDEARAVAVLDDLDEHAFTSGAAPIVLAPARDRALAARIAPLRRDVGVMAPASPLSLLLARGVARPLVVTSANTHGAPIPIDDAALAPSLADLMLTHDRQVARPLDDSIVRVVGGRARIVRLGRGMAPRALPLPSARADGTLALSCHEHTAPALAVGERALLGAHVGDLETHEARDRLLDTARDLERLAHAPARALAVDLHEGAGAHDVARARALPTRAVPHHAAHAAALVAEHGLSRALVFTFDGTGLGRDGALWGGDALLVDARGVTRVARMRGFSLVGGDAAILDVRRQALAAAAAVAGGEPLAARAQALFATPVEDETARGVVSRATRGAPPLAASVGRLFDVVAALLGYPEVRADDGAAASFVEDLAADTRDEDAHHFDISVVDESSVLVLDWAPLVVALVDARERGVSAASCARGFHLALARACAAVVVARGEDAPVGLVGGAAVNRVLTDAMARALAPRRLVLAADAPFGDGGLAYGQLAALAASWSA